LESDISYHFDIQVSFSFAFSLSQILKINNAACTQQLLLNFASKK